MNVNPQQRQQPPPPRERLCLIASTPVVVATSTPSQLLRPGSDDGGPGNSLNRGARKPVACRLAVLVDDAPRNTAMHQLSTSEAHSHDPLCFKTVAKHQQATLSGAASSSAGWLPDLSRSRVDRAVGGPMWSTVALVTCLSLPATNSSQRTAQFRVPSRSPRGRSHWLVARACQ